MKFDYTKYPDNGVQKNILGGFLAAAAATPELLLDLDPTDFTVEIKFNGVSIPVDIVMRAVQESLKGKIPNDRKLYLVPAEDGSRVRLVHSRLTGLVRSLRTIITEKVVADPEKVINAVTDSNALIAAEAISVLEKISERAEEELIPELSEYADELISAYNDFVLKQGADLAEQVTKAVVAINEPARRTVKRFRELAAV